jgi:hypothetical protein
MSTLKPYSHDLVRIPAELEYLTDYIQQSVASSNLVVGQWITKTTASGTSYVTTKTPRFLLATNDGYGTATGHKTTSIDLATASLEPTIPAEQIDTNTVKVGNTMYYNTPSGVTSVENDHPTTFNATIMVYDFLVGKTLPEIQAYFGQDYTIENVAPVGSGYFPANTFNPTTKLGSGSYLAGTVTAARVIADCVASNIYNTKTGKFLNGSYPWLPKNATVANMPLFTVTTTYAKATDNQVASVFPYLQIEGGKLINNTFVNKLLYNEVPSVMKNPAGYNFTPTYIITMYNEPTTPATVDIMGSKVGMGNSNGWIQLASFTELNIVELADETQDGYIDKNTNTFYVNPSKKCVFRVGYTQAKMGDPFGKTYDWEGAIRYSDKAWSKFYYTL